MTTLIPPVEQAACSRWGRLLQVAEEAHPAPPTLARPPLRFSDFDLICSAALIQKACPAGPLHWQETFAGWFLQ